MKTYLGNPAPLPGTTASAHPVDVVFHLGRTRRFGGWANPEWTVLHHSMLTSMLFLRNYGALGVQHALLHDAHEFITGDIPTPVKKLFGEEEVRGVEHHLDEVIYTSLDLPSGMTQTTALRVKFCDVAALIVEAYHFGCRTLDLDHIAETGWRGLTYDFQREVARIVRTSCPEVYAAMLVSAWFNTQHDSDPWGLR